MNYQIYFHHIVQTCNEIDDDENEIEGNPYLNMDDLYPMFDKDITIRLMDEYGDKKTFPAYEWHFECWLDFEATSDEEAIVIHEKVLKDHDLEWVSVYFIVSGFRQQRVVKDFTGGEE